ncbi:MAG TPA: UDP-N-acetylmuramoyl-tripeptide--D-alanyl-D-alanine ligase [Cytophagales bacterium]|nr:UDP-N-acetylmuramoyl-tripeptide--D-alanyl-D-alanine ligase [Cytophagales bacterium]
MATDIKNLYEKFKRTGQVSTDTRKITRGSVFFSLKGDKFNANEFAAEALAKGAAYAVVDEAEWVKGDQYVLVEDGLKALQDLARYHRKQLDIPIVALTGSNGKTTSKELLREVLSAKYKVLATQGNLNNHIGVPLTILSIDDSIELAVIEMGANHVGEIALLCDIANPTHGFITNIGKAHIGTFGGFENIIRGKSELYQHLINNKGTVWINSFNPILTNMSKRFEAPLFYPAKGDYYHCEMISADPFLKLRTEKDELIQTQLIGAYNFENVAAALCIGKYFNVDSAQAKRAVERYTPENMRSQLVKKGTNTIILDAYNANPSSMEVALVSLGQMKAAKKIAIIGDMYELEGESEAEHKKVAKWVVDNDIDEVLLCGELIKAAAQSRVPSHYFSTKEALINYLKKNPIKGATILVKASRGMALESVVDHL